MALTREDIAQLKAAVEESDEQWGKALEERDERIEENAVVTRDLKRKLGDLEKATLDAKADLKLALEEVAKSGEKSKEYDSAVKALADLERRLGRPGPGAAGYQSADAPAKTIGQQFSEELASARMNDTLSALRRGARGSGDVYFGPEFVQQGRALLAMKAAHVPYSADALQEFVKATVSTTDATRLIPPLRDLMLPQIKRGLSIRDFMPVRSIASGSFEYIETLGLGPETGTAIASLTSSGFAATLTTTGAHGLRAGDRVEISGAVEAGYNGVWFVSSVTSTTVVVLALDTDPADDTPTGTILWRNMSLYGAAAGVVEADTKPEARLKFTLRTGLVQVIAHWIPATRQVLDDMPELQSMIDNDLSYGVMLAEERQLLYGSGSGATLQGILTHAQRQQLSQTASSLSLLNVLRRGITMLENAEQVPGVFVMNPSDREAVDTVVSPVDEHYLLVNGTNAQGRSVVWNVPIHSTKSIAPKDVLCAAFDGGAQLYDRQQVGVRFSEHHASYFTSNMLAILAEERVGVAWKRPEAFVHITLS